LHPLVWLHICKNYDSILEPIAASLCTQILHYPMHVLYGGFGTVCKLHALQIEAFHDSLSVAFVDLATATGEAGKEEGGETGAVDDMVEFFDDAWVLQKTMEFVGISETLTKTSTYVRARAKRAGERRVLLRRASTRSGRANEAGERAKRAQRRRVLLQQERASEGARAKRSQRRRVLLRQERASRGRERNARKEGVFFCGRSGRAGGESETRAKKTFPTAAESGSLEECVSFCGRSGRARGRERNAREEDMFVLRPIGLAQRSVCFCGRSGRARGGERNARKEDVFPSAAESGSLKECVLLRQKRVASLCVVLGASPLTHM
jgi:hypothetical protein